MSMKLLALVLSGKQSTSVFIKIGFWIPGFNALNPHLLID